MAATKRDPGNRITNLFQPAAPEPAYLPDGWVDLLEVAREFQVSLRTLNRWCHKGLVCSRVGNRRFFLKSEINRFLLANQVQPKKRA